jgi:hypothetical protein
MEYRKRVDALVFFSLLSSDTLLLMHMGRVSATAALGGDVGFPPCKDNKCYCCIGGRTHARYSTLAECSHACF